MNNFNYAQDIYTHNEVDRMLRADRTVKYEYVIRNQYNKTIGHLTNCDGSVAFDSTKEIMRTCSLTAKRSELLDINSVDDRIVPYFCILAPNGHWLKYPLGVFLINPSSILRNKNTYITVDGYDLAEIANAVKLEKSVTYKAGAVYTSAIAQRLSALDYNLLDIVQDETLTRRVDYDYEIGATEITTINDMLNAINYYPLYFDEYGKAHVEPYIYPEARKVQIQYSADNKSIIYDGLAQSSDLFNIPNVFIRYTNDSDSPSLIAKYEVEDESIPSSIVNRGRRITDVQSVDDVTSQAALEALTRRAAIAGSQQTEELKFTTVNMPGHGFKNCLQVRCDDAGIDGKYIEYAWNMTLSAGGTMTHQCYKAVSL